jgi:hypothetical protein
MNVLRFSLPRVFSISRNSRESMVMLMLCFMSVASLRSVYLIYRKALLALLHKIASRGRSNENPTHIR